MEDVWMIWFLYSKHFRPVSGRFIMYIWICFSMYTACDAVESMYWHLEDMEFPKYFSTSNFPFAHTVILVIYF
jgi:hypothetical protein